MRLFKIKILTSDDFHIILNDLDFDAIGPCNMLIFASQVSDSHIVTNPLVDLARIYMMCREIPGHLIKLHLVKNMKTI